MKQKQKPEHQYHTYQGGEHQRLDHQNKQRNTAVTVGVYYNQEQDFRYAMQELTHLAEACHFQVIGEVTQHIKRINSSLYIGRGKLDELKVLLEKSGADLVLFNDELSASQMRNLEEELSCRVLDRTGLILDIFAARAKTREAQLQVEVAQWQYKLPRLVGSRESLGRQGGGSGLKNRGSGETKLELDRRKIEDKISQLNQELETVVAQRKIQRKKRKKKEVPVIALVGYTNAGKSSLLNAMVDLFHGGQGGSEKQVLEKDMLFATLDTSVRSIKLPDNKSFLLTDTVGFVSKLPHQLVQAFRSTLEEVLEADLLIHVVDCANPNYEQQIKITNKTLQEIGIEQIPVLYVFNKADLTDRTGPVARGAEIYISAKQQWGIEELIQLIREQLFKDYIQCDLLIPYDQGRILSYFNEHAHVLSTLYEPNGTKLNVECSRADYDKYKRYVVG